MGPWALQLSVCNLCQCVHCISYFRLFFYYHRVYVSICVHCVLCCSVCVGGQGYMLVSMHRPHYLGSWQGWLACAFSNPPCHTHNQWLEQQPCLAFTDVLQILTQSCSLTVDQKPRRLSQTISTPISGAVSPWRWHIFWLRPFSVCLLCTMIHFNFPFSTL